MRPQNSLALRVLEQLKTMSLTDCARPGYFGVSSNCCIGLRAKTWADAFQFGASLGDCGAISCATIPQEVGAILVFLDAHVSA